MTLIHEIASGVSDNSAGSDKFRNTFSAIGRANDAEASAIAGQRSAVSLLKGILSGLGIADGSGAGVTNGNPNLLDDGLAAMGTQEDGPAGDPDDVASAISIAKGILTRAGFV